MATEAVFVEVMNSTVLYMDGTGNEFYQKYKDVGVIWIAMPALTLIILFVLIGFWGNGNIVIATWRNKALHGPCNYLLAISAAVDSLHGLSQFVQASIFYTGINFIPLKLCVFLQTLPLTGLNFGIILILLIGIDRVLSVMLPGRHRSMNVGVYMAIMMGICMAYNLILLYFTYDFALKHANSPSACSIVDAMPSTPGEIWFYLCIALNISTVFCYVIVYLAIKFKSGVSSSTKRVFKSLSIITAVVFFGWTINAICRTTLTLLQLDLEHFWIIGMYTGVLVNAATGSNYFILFATSNEYAFVFKQYLNNISRILCGKEVVRERKASIITIHPTGSATRF